MYYAIELLAWLTTVGCQRRSFKDSSGREHYGIIQSIEREDGSGKNFNVYYLDVTGKQQSAFVRTR